MPTFKDLKREAVPTDSMPRFGHFAEDWAGRVHIIGEFAATYERYPVCTL
jgi:hypothetical protein